MWWALRNLSVGIVILGKGVFCTSSVSNERCIEFCRLRVSGCTGSTYCNAENDCQNLFWTNGERADVVELAAVQMEGDILLPVKCEEAASHQSRKRSRPASEVSRTRSGRAYMRSRPPENFEASSPTILVEETAASADTLMVEDTARESAVPSDASSRQILPAGDPEDPDDDSMPVSEEVREGVDDGNRGGVRDEEENHGGHRDEEEENDDDGAEGEEEEEGNDDDDDDDDETEGEEEEGSDPVASIQAASRGAMIVFDNIDLVAQDFPSIQALVEESFGGEAGQQLMVRLAFQELPGIMRDPLDDYSEWIDLALGVEVRELMVQVVDVLGTGLLRELTQFPFLDLSRTEQVFVQNFVVNETLDEIARLLINQNDTRHLVSVVMRIPAVRRWEASISAMSAACLNSESLQQDETTMSFARDQAGLFRKFLSSIKSENHPHLPPSLLGGSEQDPPTATFSPSVPCHATISCSFCRLMADTSLRLRPSSVSSFAQSLIGQFSSFHSPPLRSHAMCLCQLVGQSEAADIGDFCEVHANTLFEYIFSNFVENRDHEPLSTLERLSLLGMARKCKAGISYNNRRDAIPQLLRFTSFSSTHRLPAIRLEVDQAPEKIMEETLNALSTNDKLDFLSGRIDVRFSRSQSIGIGPLNELLSKVLPLIFLPSSGLFVYSDSREAQMKPAPLSEGDAELRSTQIRKLRQVGRLIAIALQKDMVAGAILTSGCLSYLIGGGGDLLEMLREEDAEKFENLIKLRKSLQGVEGMLFPFGDEELNHENVERFILAHAQQQVLDSVQTQMQAILMGLYDVLPFGQLAWFISPQELRPLLEGDRDIDKAALQATSTVTLLPTLRIEQVPEITWFWEIVDDLSPQHLGELLLFVSGSTFPPIHGFAGPKNDRTWLQISIDPTIRKDGLPKSQLCFVQLKLPRYSDKPTMQDRLICAITECKTMERV